jgi:hypothetical protein
MRVLRLQCVCGAHLVLKLQDLLGRLSYEQ